jgi:hypothetical protein
MFSFAMIAALETSGERGNRQRASPSVDTWIQGWPIWYIRFGIGTSTKGTSCRVRKRLWFSVHRGQWATR